MFSPTPSIFGATTATTLYEAINSSVVDSGFLPRLLVFRAPDSIPTPNLDWEDAAIPQAVHEWLKAIRTRVELRRTSSSQTSNLAGAWNNNYDPVEVPYSAEAIALFRSAQLEIIDRRNETDDPLESNMLSRLVENTGRVALILALCADPWAVEVGAEHFVTAMRIVQQATNEFMADIRMNLFDSAHAKVEVSVTAKIRDHFTRTGKPISDGILVDRCRAYNSARPHDRKAVIESLTRQGKITVHDGRNKGALLYRPSFDQ